MKGEEGIKHLVKEKYTQIVKQSSGSGCCCGTDSGCCTDYSTFSDDYTKLAGYNSNADLKLGCGIPTEAAQIKAGDVVVDLGSGAGNDAFVARAIVGEKGQVIGIDMTEAMVEKARKNAASLKFSNVEFRLGEIEKMPIADNTADVVISNCVLNLVPSKRKAFSETLRILKSKGHFSISDVVLLQPLPASAQAAAELYAGCVAGALLKDEYLSIIKETGFTNIKVVIEKPLSVPEDLLSRYVSAEELRSLDRSKPLALSITVYGEKP
jgi:SAM-dependent methyltransferase